MDLYLYRFNNYYNRIVKKFDNLNGYGEYLHRETDVNFIPNDGISTSQIVNYNGEIPDYLICVERSASGNVINSRWFIIEAIRTRNGQFLMQLYRDVIADWYDEIVAAPCFIEKATLSKTNPLIFNREDMTYNQIKTSETLLKDISGVPWIVGYVDKSYAADEDITIQLPSQDLYIDYILNDLSEYTYYKYNADNPFTYANQYAIMFNMYDIRSSFNSRRSWCWSWNKFGEQINIDYESFEGTGEYTLHKINEPLGIGYATYLNPESLNYLGANDVKSFVLNNSWTDYSPRDYIQAISSESMSWQTLTREDGKIIQINTGSASEPAYEYYSIKVISNENNPIAYGDISSGSALGLLLEELATELENNRYLEKTYNSPKFQMAAKYTSYHIEYEPISIGEGNNTITIKHKRAHSDLTPYDIFCIPYGSVKTGTNMGTTIYQGHRDQALRLANALIESIGKDRLYDIQLLPYCPIPHRYESRGELQIFLDGPDGDSALQIGDKIAALLFWVTNPDFEVRIDHNISVPSDDIEFKVTSECDVHRLVSPNYNGQFEFSAAKNNGVYGFLADCSYKPYMPYIKVSPIFNGLYGKDFDDARGLICGGDFSLTQISDKYVEYSVNNKNFQEIFNRQIENMDINNSINRKREMWQIAGGAISGSASMGMGLGLINPIAGAVGAAAGGAASVAAGVADLKLSDQLRTEARDYSIDQFGYQLGNIKAMPNSLTKVSSLNKNNKLFPVLEYYTATVTEKEALREKIRYNGMTVMTIGKIEDYIRSEQSYIKARLIRLDIDDEYHTVKVISEELNKGVFI